MADGSQRKTVTPAQATLMNEVLLGAPRHVTEAAVRIGQGEVVSDVDAEAVVGALATAMLGDKGYSQAGGLTERGIEIDKLIGVVQQMSEHFYN